MGTPHELRYAATHEWAKREGELVRVGISDYAQDQLGDIVFIELPEVGREVEQGEGFGVVESVKAVDDRRTWMSIAEALASNRLD